MFTLGDVSLGLGLVEHREIFLTVLTGGQRLASFRRLPQLPPDRAPSLHGETTYTRALHHDHPDRGTMVVHVHALSLRPKIHDLLRVSQCLSMFHGTTHVHTV